MTRRILATGGTGQVGLALSRVDWPADVVLDLPGRADLDLRSPASIEAAFARHDYAAVISSGAYTAVDRAEDDAADAFRVNAQAPMVLAECCARAGIPIVQISTDYVFDGSGTGFRTEDEAVRPIGVYGASKLGGELAVASIQPRSVVLRTAWVLSADGSNFLKTMLRLGATRDELGVVADQMGCPTAASDIAEAVRTIVVRLLDDADAPTGLFHFVNAGEASWHDLASEIFRQSQAQGGPSPKVNALTTKDFPTRALRPANSRLSTAKIAEMYNVRPRPWQDAVSDILATLSSKDMG